MVSDKNIIIEINRRFEGWTTRVFGDYIQVVTNKKLFGFDGYFLMFFVKEQENGRDLIVTDLNHFLDISRSNGMDNEKYEKIVTSDGFDFDGINISKITSLEMLTETIGDFIHLSRKLGIIED